MRPLARAVAILCLSTVVSCSEDAPTRPTTTRTEVTVPVSVFDVDGAPMSVDVYLTDEAASWSVMVTTGAAPVSAKVPVRDLRVTVVPGAYSGYPNIVIPGFRVRDGARLDYRYAGARLAGAASSAEEALDGVWVAVSTGTVPPSLEDPAALWAQQISSGGRFGFVVPPGGYLVRARPPSSRPELPQLERRITVEDDEPLDLDFSGHETLVQVTVKEQPVGSAAVFARGAEASWRGSTDAAGTSRMVLPGGNYDFEVRGILGVMTPLIAPRSVTAAGTVPLDFTGDTWMVTLRRMDDHSPVARATVDVREVGTARRGLQLTDDEGRFEMVVTPGTAHSVSVLIPQWRASGPYPVAGTVVSSGDATFDLLVDLPPAP
jgi:hypothetical protein